VNDNCKECIKRQDINYEEAVKRFDKALNKAIIIQLICMCITFISLLVTIFTIERFTKVMESYEYVEETCYEIKQDDGTNTAIISNGESEVRLYEPN
jgi:hypothetical protein